MKYLMRIEEILRRHVIVEAENAIEAREIVYDKYSNKGEIVLDYDDLADSKIEFARVAFESDEPYYEMIN